MATENKDIFMSSVVLSVVMWRRPADGKLDAKLELNPKADEDLVKACQVLHHVLDSIENSTMKEYHRRKKAGLL